MTRSSGLVVAFLVGTMLSGCGGAGGSGAPGYEIVSENETPAPQINSSYVDVSVSTDARKTEELRAIAEDLKEKHPDSYVVNVSFVGEGSEGQVAPVGSAQAFEGEEAARTFFGDAYDAWKKPLEENDYTLVLTEGESEDDVDQVVDDMAQDMCDDWTKEDRETLDRRRRSGIAER